MKSTTNKPPPQPKMYETENDISQNRRVEISALLNQRLADAVDLQTQMKQVHLTIQSSAIAARRCAASPSPKTS